MKERSFVGFLFLIEKGYNRIVAPIYVYFHLLTGTGLFGDFFLSVLHALICGLVLDFVRLQGLVVAIRRAFRGAVFGKIWLVDSAVLG